MFLAALLVIIGSGMSLWAVLFQNQTLALAGIIVVITVCVSWWFWVMFIIKTMLSLNNSTLENVKDIQAGISAVKQLLQDYEKTRQR